MCRDKVVLLGLAAHVYDAVTRCRTRRVGITAVRCGARWVDFRGRGGGAKAEDVGQVGLVIRDGRIDSAVRCQL